MQDWKLRVKNEKSELDDNLGRLSLFIDGVKFEHLPIESKRLLKEQEGHMSAYSETLGKRLSLDV